MSYPGFFAVLIFPFCLSGGWSLYGQAPPDAPPNVLFILADDLGYHDLSCTGSRFYETPNIDRIAQEGTRFEQGYATSAVCSPSRASILTGTFTARHGITDWIGAKTGQSWSALNRRTQLLPPDYVHRLPSEDITLAEALKEAGYQTLFVGKWHLGGKGSLPEDHGFDQNIGGWEAGSPKGGYFAPYQNPSLEGKKEGENLSLRLAEECSKFIQRHSQEPFFAFLSFYAVHGPIQTKEEKWRKYRDKAEKMGLADSGFQLEKRLPIRHTQDNPVYAGLVETMDEAIGEVLHTLDSLGLDKNTLIIFTSDNGGVASGDAYSTSNLPLRGGKGYQWEGGIREPFFIKVPFLDTSVKSTSIPVTGADLYPTILDVLDLKLKPQQHRDGRSLKPILMGKGLKKRALYWHYPHYGNQGGDPSSIIRKGKWKLIYYWEDQSRALYNLEEDISETNDLAAEKPKRARKLAKQLKAWLKSLEAQEPSPDPRHSPSLEKEYLERLRPKLLRKREKERLNFLEENYQPNANWWGSKVE